jgi:hypothetical protein
MYIYNVCVCVCVCVYIYVCVVDNKNDYISCVSNSNLLIVSLSTPRLQNINNIITRAAASSRVQQHYHGLISSGLAFMIE